MNNLQRIGSFHGDIRLIIVSEGKNEGFEGEFTVEAIKRWIEVCSHHQTMRKLRSTFQITRIPLITSLDQHNVQDIFVGDIKRFILLQSTHDVYPALKEDFAAAAKQFRPSVSVVRF